ncbi:MAG: hypothetical protein GXP04_12835 [Alphaproteobacteria bacterium]|nr:hypothetical protein [Alphaproteobacteria bacterium]
MATSDYSDTRRSGGAGWFYAPIILILILGAALSVGAYFYSDTQLTVVEAITAGYAGMAGLIIGLIGAAFGIVVGLLGALIGIVAAGGAVALTLFIVGSPLLAIVLIIMLMRRSKSSAECPDPGAHE